MKNIYLLLIILIPLSLVRSQAYWKEITTMRYPVTGGQVVFNNSRIEPKFYILGGYSDSLQKAVDWIQEYDLLKNTWKIVGHMNTPRMFFLSSVWDSTIVYCGGAEYGSFFRESLTLWNFYKENHPAIYDSSSEFDRSFAAGQVFQDRLFLIGGNSSIVQNQISYIVEYDLINKTITYLYNYKTTSNPEDQMTFLTDDTIYILGGKYNGVQNWIKKFSFTSKELVDLNQTLPTPRAGGAGIYNRRLKKAFLIGGYSEGEKNYALQSVEEINFKSDGSLIISPASSLNNARRNPMVVNYLNAMVVFGGKDASGKIVSKVEQYIDTTIHINNPPYFTYTDIPQNVEVSVPPKEFSFQFLATDPEGDAIVFSLEEGPEGSSITKSGLFKWSPTITQANKEFKITVRVSDGELSQTFSTMVTTDTAVTSTENTESIPSVTVLFQNYPNPFNPTTTISYSLNKNSHVLISIYDVLGREVKNLVNSYKNAGYHSVFFNAENMHSGVYFYKIVTDNFVDAKRMLLLK